MNTRQHTHPFKLLFSSFLDVIAPSHCMICGDYIAEHQRQRSSFLCASCLDSLPAAPSAAEIYDDLLRHFPGDSLAITNGYARYAALHNKEEEGILSAIHKLKYQGFSGLGIELGEELGLMLKHLGVGGYDALVPVPIHHARRRERGYNQAECIAQGMSKVMNIPLNSKLIKRSRYTSSQTKLSKEERSQNIAGAFCGGKEWQTLRNGSFLLVDDVLTTGSTLNTIATTMLELGARQVDIATVAKAV